MSELKFICVDNEEYKTKNVFVENAIIDIKEEDYKVINRILNKYKQTKVYMVILDKEIKSKLKIFEEQINEYLKNKMGAEAITILYGNQIYPKTSELLGQEKEEHHIKIKSIWINENNKPFVQLWYVHHTN